MLRTAILRVAPVLALNRRGPRQYHRRWLSGLINDMTVEVFWISGSAPAWRVLLTLEIKRLPYRSRVLQTSTKEQKQDWFLELNPRGQIPVLRDGGNVFCESLAIMHYLEKKQPEPAVFGASSVQTGQIEQYVHEILSYTDPAISRFVQPVFRGRTENLEKDGAQIAADIHSELTGLDARIGDRHWIAGEHISAADLTLIPTLQRLRRATNKQPNLASSIGLDRMDQRYPSLTGWIRRSEALQAFEDTFPPHWRRPGT